MKQKFIKSLIVTVLTLAVVFCSVFSASALPINNVNNSYFYNVDGVDAAAPMAFTVEKYISVVDIVPNATATTAFSPTDLFYKNGYLYVLDMKGNCVYVLDERYQLVSTIRTLTGDIPELALTAETTEGEDGEQQTVVVTSNKYALNAPQGIFVTDDGTIYISDTENQRILACDINGKVSKVLQAIKIPVLGENYLFKPTRLVVDNVGDVQVVCYGINRGVVQISSEGTFNAFFGTPKVIVNFGERIWRNFATEEQLAQMVTYTPTEYSSISIDARGFIYTTISALEEAAVNGLSSRSTNTNHAPVRKLSADGTDMLRRKGLAAPMGDLTWPKIKDYAPKIVDVAIDNESGRYTILDQTAGRFSTYDNDGNLLYICGGVGTSIGTFQMASALEINGNYVYVADTINNSITVFKATPYTLAINKAAEATSAGYWAECIPLWEDVLSYNSNMYIANLSLGNAEMQLAAKLLEGQVDAMGMTSFDHYENAMVYYDRANEKANYSTAYMAIRTHELEKYFGLIFGSIAVLIVGYFIFSIVRKQKKRKKEKAEKLAAALAKQKIAQEKYNQAKGDAK